VQKVSEAQPEEGGNQKMTYRERMVRKREIESVTEEYFEGSFCELFEKSESNEKRIEKLERQVDVLVKMNGAKVAKEAQ